MTFPTMTGRALQLNAVSSSFQLLTETSDNIAHDGIATGSYDIISNEHAETADRGAECVRHSRIVAEPPRVFRGVPYVSAATMAGAS